MIYFSQADRNLRDTKRTLIRECRPYYIQDRTHVVTLRM